MSQLRIVYFGTPDFAVAPLDALIKKGYNIVGVVTAPDKPAGRGQKIQMSAVKEYALAKDLTVLQPEKLKNQEFLSELKELKADLQIVVAFRMLPESVWNMSPLGTFNLHASLLPQYRGAAPINWAIINGEKETGVTTFFLKHEIDTGNVLFQKKTEIKPNETAGELHDRLMDIRAELVFETVKAIEQHTIQPKDQETLIAGELKHAPKLFKEDCRINWNVSTKEIINRIHGLSPYPTSFFEIKNDKDEILNIKVFKGQAEPLNSPIEVGSFVTDNKTYIKVATSDGLITLTDMQLQGKKRMPTPDFLRGFDISNWKVVL